MKKLFLSLLLAYAFTLPLSSQINPWLGEIPIQNCNLDTNCSFLFLDTSATNIWQVGTTSKPFFGAAYSPPNGLMTDTLNPYPDSADSWFEVRLPNTQWYFGFIFSFTHKYEFDSAHDVGTILCSYDHGQTWTNVMEEPIVHSPIEFNTENMYSLSDTNVGGTPGFLGTDSVWKLSRIQWTWIVPVLRTSGPFLPDTLYLRFLMKSDSTNDSLDGWILDDLDFSTVEYGGAISDPWLAAYVDVYPNPFDEKLEINIDERAGEGILFELLDIHGRVVMKNVFASAGKHELNTSDIDPGFYIVRMSDERGRVAWGRVVRE